MSIFRSDEYRSNSMRIDSVHSNFNEEEERKKKRRKVAYKGRSWSEGEEEDLPVQPPPPTREPKERKGLYANQALLERAEKLLAQFCTVEEKIGQLSFFQTEAFYDRNAQLEIERLIQMWQIGGLLFTKGEFRRQSYLIEQYQEKSRVPLLIGNDFLHGLSFYFQGEIPLPSLEVMDERRSSDLGKAVVFQNRRLGVHFQFDRELRRCGEKEGRVLSDAQARSFRNGIREAQGIVGKEKGKHQKISHSSKMAQAAPFLTQMTSTDQIQEVFALRTINFLDLTPYGRGHERKVLEALKTPYDAFLLNGGEEEMLHILTKAVRLGDVRETDLDKHLLKVLILKMSLFRL